MPSFVAGSLCVDRGLLVKYQAVHRGASKPENDELGVNAKLLRVRETRCVKLRRQMTQCASRFEFCGDCLGKILDTLAYALYSQ